MLMRFVFLKKLKTKRLKDRAPQTTAFGIYLGFDK
jgi:hypothetical protein